MEAATVPESSLFTPFHRSSIFCTFVVAVTLLLACRGTAHAEPPPLQVLRTDDGQIASALKRGRAQSPTFRAILDRLAESDLIIYLRRGRLHGHTAAATQLMSAVGGVRYVRVTLELDPVSDVGVAMLGHELRHALEFAQAPWVVDSGAVIALYREIGYATCSRPAPCYDTREAVDAGRRVFVELRRTDRRLDALSLPVTLREEPRADHRQRKEGNAHRDERASWAEPAHSREQPR
jgi:hypothetical protein